MQHELVLTPRFERAFRRLVAKNPTLQSQIETALRRMAADIGDPRLKTHHLSGQLKGLHACSVGYDCRIVFCPAETLQDRRGSAAAGQPRLARGSLLSQGMTMKTALLPLEHLDFVVDSKNRKLIPNPEHGDKQMSEEY